MKRQSAVYAIYPAVLGFLLFFTAGTAAAYDIDRKELESSQKDIEFINYVGPHETVSTRGEIVQIGKTLAAQDSFFGKYRVIRAVSRENPDKRAADIFVIEGEARVDHIRNVRAMVSGYLQEAYSLSPGKAETMAVFITVYNAVYRGDMETLAARYKPVVMEHLSSSNAGIALNYAEWPGKTRMVIPLRSEETRGEREKVDTGELSDESVVEEMQKEEDRGVEERKDMVEIREEELEREREAVEEEEAELAEKTEPTRTAEKPEKDEPGPDQPPEEEPSEGGTEADETTQGLEKQREDLEKRKERLEEEEQEVREERKEIAQDENEVIREQREEEKKEREAQVRSPGVEPFFFLEVREDGGEPLGRIVMADENTGKILYRSEVNTIRGRAFLRQNGRLLVIAGKTGGTQMVKALFLNSETLQVTLEGRHAVHPGSGLWQRDGSYYMVFEDEEDGSWKLGRFNQELKLQRQSETAVFPLTAAVFENNGLYVQNPGGAILKLDPSTLEQQARIE